MGKARECCVCRMLLSRNEREVVEVTVSGGSPTVMEACARCHAKVAAAGAVAFCVDKLTHVARPGPYQRQLFPAASGSSSRSGGRRG